MLIPILLFILGLICLIKGGDWFVDGAAGLARRFNLPEILIGATIVSIGTTLPEVMVSATSAATGHGELAYGNAIGSIICNTALIAAITMAIKPAKIEKKSLILPAVTLFVSAAVYCAISYTTGIFSRPVGFILLAMFVMYIIISVRQSLSSIKGRNHTGEAALVTDSRLGEGSEALADAGSVEEEKKEMPLWKMLLFLVLGAALIAVGARLLVDNGTKIASALGVPESVIALTFVALGTSLPELVTAITSLVKGHGALSVGNILGANIFNIVLVSGLSIVINPFPLPASKLIMGQNASLVIDLPLMVIVSLIMVLPALIKGKLYRWQGILLLAIYAGFVVFQFAT
ncbi:MAG: calcium/sodium antiporter [Parasporobacterium sp.]|nr:calcium/sodium antiporter [Parasporobacterium sp.]